MSNRFCRFWVMISAFFVLSGGKLNIFGFWTMSVFVGQNKRDISLDDNRHFVKQIIY